MLSSTLYANPRSLESLSNAGFLNSMTFIHRSPHFMVFFVKKVADCKLGLLNVNYCVLLLFVSIFFILTISLLLWLLCLLLPDLFLQLLLLLLHHLFPLCGL